MVCSACGYENQAGNRFCGMCGTPLPHRPLTAPGAQGTHSLTRVPLEVANPDESRRGTTNPADLRSPNVPDRSGVLLEMPSAQSRSGGSPQPEKLGSSEMVPEVPLEEYVKSFHYVPPSNPDEVTMRGDERISRPKASAVSDPPILAPAGPVAATNTSVTQPSALPEDVGDRLGLEDTPDVDERHDRPRFLDFNDPAPSLEKPEATESDTAVPSFLKLSDIRRVSVQPPAAETVSQLRTVLQAKQPTAGGKPSLGRGLTWLAVAALIAFVALGGVEWRSRVNHTNDGPVEVVKTRIESIMRRYNLRRQTADSAGANPAKPAILAEEQPKSSPSPEHNATPNLSTPSPAAATNPPVADSARGNATNPPQDATAVGASKLGEQKTVRPPALGSPLNEVEPATAQKSAQPKAEPSANAPRVTPVAEVPKPPASVADRAKPKPLSDQSEQTVAVNKAAPGNDELAKASNASDSAAAAAWLWKATAKGNPDAPVRLADMYVKGDGVPRSCEQALVLLKTAAAKQNARARNRLAVMYNNGTCVQRNRVQAYRWLSSALAADPNSHWARENRDLIWEQMTPEERAAAQQYR